MSAPRPFWECPDCGAREILRLSGRRWAIVGAGARAPPAAGGRARCIPRCTLCGGFSRRRCCSAWGSAPATAADLLAISPSTLRTWERRYGFPEPRRSTGGHRIYDRAEVEALRDAYAETGHAASAVELARTRGSSFAPPSCAGLRAALTAFDEDAADRIAVEALAARSLEAVVEELVLVGVDGLPDRTPERALGHRWATGWLAAQRRLAPPASRLEGVLVLDAGGPDVLHVAALELALRRAGLRVLVLPVALDPERLQRAITVLNPALVVLGGRGAALDAVGRAVFASRRARGERVAVCDFRGALRGSTTVPRVGPDLRAARDAVLELVERRRVAQDVPEVAPTARRGRLRVAG
jgi:hypothetical protein